MKKDDIKLPPLPYPYDTPAYRSVGAVIQDYALAAIEQTMLQSPEVQALKRDKERLDWLEASEDSHGFCHAGYGDYIYYAHQEKGYPSVREVIDAAMGQKEVS